MKPTKEPTATKSVVITVLSLCTRRACKGISFQHARRVPFEHHINRVPRHNVVCATVDFPRVRLIMASLNERNYMQGPHLTLP
jgi:hypothetical protein